MSAELGGCWATVTVEPSSRRYSAWYVAVPELLILSARSLMAEMLWTALLAADRTPQPSPVASATTAAAAKPIERARIDVIPVNVGLVTRMANGMSLPRHVMCRTAGARRVAARRDNVRAWRSPSGGRGPATCAASAA